VSPVSEPIVVTCKDRNMTTDVLLSDLDKYFEKAPVIVIIPNEEREKLIHHMK